MAVDSSSATSKKGSASAGPFSFRAPASGGVRFAPSPTGRFHLGNLRTAWISWTLAQRLSLPWVVRFEDIDEPRVLAGAREDQLRDMAALGLVPSIELVQSSFRARHLELFALARSTGAVYACVCSRREVQQALAGSASAPHGGLAPVYSGHCRLQACSRASIDAAAGAGSLSATNAGSLAHAAGVAWRFKMDDPSGQHDFIIARTTDLVGDQGFVPAYHWACAIDDFDGAYDWIVRSSDLAAALPLQRAIYAWVTHATGAKLPRVRAFHTSLVAQNDGHRLEKRTGGVTLPELALQGFTPPKLLDVFSQSFALPSDLSRDVISEPLPSVTLDALLTPSRF